MFDSDEKDRQVEFLFDLPATKKKSKKTRFGLGRIAVSLSYENLFILSIGLIMLLIVCYSLGVERGRCSVHLESKSKEIIESPQMEKPPDIKLPYTIQVATFRKATSVNKELKRLQKKGYRPFVINRGEFSEICVGNYSNKKDAVVDLKKLRKIYADCYVRKK